MTQIISFPRTRRTKDRDGISAASHTHSGNERPLNLWDTLDRIQHTLALSGADMADYMSATLSEFERYRLRGESPPLKPLISFCEATALSLETVLRGEIDYQALARSAAGKNPELPEQYAKNAFSRKRAAINILNSLETFYGWRKRAEVLRRFQLTEQMFTDPDGWMNMKLAVDISTYLVHSHGSKAPLERIGRFSTFTHLLSPMGKELSTQPDLRSLYVCFFDGNMAEQYIERNNAWTIATLEQDLCKITAVPKADVADQVGREAIQHPYPCWIRKGFLEALPGYLGLPNVKVVKTGCVSQGDERCSYDVHLTSPGLRSLAPGLSLEGRPFLQGSTSSCAPRSERT